MTFRFPALLRLLLLSLLSAGAKAEVAAVTAYVPEPTAWVGQRLPFYIELRARGLFVGTASFELPQLSRALLIKIGEPVVGSEQIEGETWFVQKHEFALFAQSSGTLEVPAVGVRFARREGFTGPASDVQAHSSAFKLEIRRPAGSGDIGYLVTTDSLDVTETWDPTPAAAEVGAIFKRTIVQRANELPGMALAPAATTVPDGLRAYPGDAEIEDKLVRGEFLGERRETITYLVQKSGSFVLPAISYVWWNPKMEAIESKILPAVSFEVSAPSGEPVEDSAPVRGVWPWLLAAGLLVAAGALAKRLRQQANSADRVAARQLIGACRGNDAAAAVKAWRQWRNTQDAGFQPGSDLGAAVLALQRHLFGPAPQPEWRGNELVQAFRRATSAARRRSSRAYTAALPGLNPQGRAV